MNLGTTLDNYIFAIGISQMKIIRSNYLQIILLYYFYSLFLFISIIYFIFIFIILFQVFQPWKYSNFFPFFLLFKK